MRVESENADCVVDKSQWYSKTLFRSYLNCNLVLLSVVATDVVFHFIARIS